MTTAAARKVLTSVILPSSALLISSQKWGIRHSDNTSFCENLKDRHNDAITGENDRSNKRESTIRLEKKGEILQKRVSE